MGRNLSHAQALGGGGSTNRTSHVQHNVPKLHKDETAAFFKPGKNLNK